MFLSLMDILYRQISLAKVLLKSFHINGHTVTQVIIFLGAEEIRSVSR